LERDFLAEATSAPTTNINNATQKVQIHRRCIERSSFQEHFASDYSLLQGRGEPEAGLYHRRISHQENFASNL
jgi:hypothetical protein